MKKLVLIPMLFILLSVTIHLSAQQQESYTFCTGSSYCYLLDTSTTTNSNYFQRFNIGTTTYTAHFFHDTIFQSSGTSASPGGYGSVKKWALTGNNTVSNVWTYTLSGAHHDICPMPNGNVLVIVDESINLSAYGGSSTTVKAPVIKEIKSTGTTTGTVVWEWHLKDHLCQSTNASNTATYVSNVSQYPELFNLNCNTNGGITSDWFHMNGVDYNPELDQLVMSSHIKNEIYVIDHSTTTAQAATHAGGNAGKGGDFLYRWGSPENYGCTTDGNGINLNVIHDARWVSATNSVWPNYISVYHNGGCSSGQGCVLHFPPYSTTIPYNYTYTPGTVVGPSSCVKPTTVSFNVTNMGGCHALDNGNVLITNPNQRFYETRNSSTALQNIAVGTVQSDRLKKTDLFGPWLKANASESSVCANSSFTLNCLIQTAPVISSPTYTYSWESVPATASFSSTTAQNPTVTPTVVGTYTFKCTVSMSGTFNLTTITTTNTITINVVVQACTGMENISSDKAELSVYPNPTTAIIYLNEEFTLQNNFEAMIVNSYGEILFRDNNTGMIDLSAYANGIYYLIIKTGDADLIKKKLILIK